MQCGGKRLTPAALAYDGVDNAGGALLQGGCPALRRMILAEITVEITGLPSAYLHLDYRIGIYMVESATWFETPHFPRHLVLFPNLICAQ
jgi:hypothetical protein